MKTLKRFIYVIVFLVMCFGIASIIPIALVYIIRGRDAEDYFVFWAYLEDNLT